MPLQRWSDRNESLDTLFLVIQQDTHGLICDLSLDVADDDRVVVKDVSLTYYGVQLAFHAKQQFSAASPLHPETRLLIRVEGSTLELVVIHGARNEPRESSSTHDAERRPQLTVAAIA